MRHHPPRKHPAKRQAHSDAINEAERRSLWGIDFGKAPEPTPAKVKLQPGRPKKKRTKRPLSG